MGEVVGRDDLVRQVQLRLVEEFLEPAADQGLVVFCRHGSSSFPQPRGGPLLP